MIEKLSIRNFKSIKDLELDCRKVNLFIGEPNTGKSNILEALGLLSWCGYMNRELNEYVRYKNISNLFCDGMLDKKIEIGISGGIDGAIKITYEPNRFFINSFDPLKEKTGKIQFGNEHTDLIARMDYEGIKSDIHLVPQLQFVKFYRYREYESYPNVNAMFLLPPDGDNLFPAVYSYKELRKIISSYFIDFDLRIVFKPQDRSFEFQKEVDNDIIQYPYIITSDTLKRMIFYRIAMESNNDSTLVFEEPEVHSFPDYLTILGESIGMDKTNQYFIVTHSPYLLLSILEKAMKNSVNVFITYWDNYETKVKCISDDKLQDLFTYDPFFNLRLHIEDED